MIRKTAINRQFGSNTYLLVDVGSGEAVVVDPGASAQDITTIMEGFTVRAIILTHYHFDHIASLEELKDLTSAPVMIGARDAEGLASPEVNLSLFMGQPVSPQTVDRLLADGDSVEFGPLSLVVMETPGHTPGSISLVNQDCKAVLTGDTLFLDSVGRTDMEGGNEANLFHSIGRIMKLGDDWRVLPGHGPEGFIWEIKETNPFLWK